VQVDLARHAIVHIEGPALEGDGLIERFVALEHAVGVGEAEPAVPEAEAHAQLGHIVALETEVVLEVEPGARDPPVLDPG
jgi:hypothetical protein